MKISRNLNAARSQSIKYAQQYGRNKTQTRLKEKNNLLLNGRLYIESR